MAELPLETINKIWDKGYQQGRAETISEVDEKMADILADKCSAYGVACYEAYCDAYVELEDWIAEQLKEQKNDID